MAPKKDKGKEGKYKDKPPETARNPTFTEVERTFLELQLAEANRKVARLRTVVDEYEVRNEELQTIYDKLDQDRADIIAYLKNTLNNKNEENNELKDKVKGLEETREIETAPFKETVDELERNFTTMKDQLSSENKLLADKLNTLEEFRAIRDDLMKKFEKQEQNFKDQEMKYNRIIYDGEKKFVVGKGKLKKEMEGRLLKLAQDFQDATELRIAASTHRVIRENIAVNNELDNILQSQPKQAEQHENYEKSDQVARVAIELAEERDKTMNKDVVQLKIIDHLTTALRNMKKDQSLMEKRNYDMDNLQSKIQQLTKENENLKIQVRILEQYLHGKLNENNKSGLHASKVAKECKKMKSILREAAVAIQAALKLDEWATTDRTKDIMDRQVLLSRLLSIVTQYRDIMHADSTSTLLSLWQYEKSDFVPRTASKKSKVSAQPTGPSQETLGCQKCSTGSMESSSTLGRAVCSELELNFKESLSSLVTSTQFCSSESEPSPEHEEYYVEKLLEQSKLEMQKSLMKDLALSQSIVRSVGKMHDPGLELQSRL